MRLTTEQIAVIKQKTALIFGENVRIFLFGSRIDDTKKGGDVDLLIETKIETELLKKAKLKNLLEISLNLPVDLLIVKRNTSLTAFQTIAFKNSLLL